MVGQFLIIYGYSILNFVFFFFLSAFRSTISLNGVSVNRCVVKLITSQIRIMRAQICFFNGKRSTFFFLLLLWIDLLMNQSVRWLLFRHRYKFYRYKKWREIVSFFYIIKLNGFFSFFLLERVFFPLKL